MGTYLHMFPAQQGILKYIPTKNDKYGYIFRQLGGQCEQWKGPVLFYEMEKLRLTSTFRLRPPFSADDADLMSFRRSSAPKQSNMNSIVAVNICT